MTTTGARRSRVETDCGSVTASATRAAIYLRVSTGRQAEQDLSIPDQKKQTKGWCEARGWEVAAEYVEPGASAMDDKRPEFQKMVERRATVARRSMSWSYTRSAGSFAMRLALSSTSASWRSITSS